MDVSLLSKYLNHVSIIFTEIFDKKRSSGLGVSFSIYAFLKSVQRFNRSLLT